MTEKKPRRVTLGAFGSNNDVPKGTKVDDNLLKGLIPFLDSESKRKTWPGASASKSVAPVSS